MAQTDNTYKNWNQMTDDEKLDCLGRVLTLAGSDDGFREECSQPDLNKVKAAVGREGKVTFDDDMTVRFIQTIEDAEKEIILLMPEFVPPKAGKAAPVDPKDQWLCTYITYRPGLKAG